MQGDGSTEAPDEESALCPPKVNLPTTREPVVNELLCFIQNKIEQMPFDSLVQICADFYSFEVITAAKQLLYRNVNTKDRFKRRQGSNKAKMSVSDIAKVFLELDVTNVPVFVAQNLSELPPIKSDSLDSLTILQNIESLTAQVQVLTRSQSGLVKLVQASNLDLVQSTVHHDHGGSETWDHAQNVSVDTGLDQPKNACDQTERFITDVNRDNPDDRSGESLHDSNPEEPGTICDSDIGSDSVSDCDTDDNQDAGNVTDRLTGGQVYRSVTTRVFKRKEPHDVPGGSGACGNLYSRVLQNTKLTGGTDRIDGKVQSARRDLNIQSNQSHPSMGKREKSAIVIGSGGTTNLRAASQWISKSSASMQKLCTGVFVTRLQPRCTQAQVSAHVYEVSGMRIRPEKLQTKYDTYSSFYIRCDKALRNTLLQAVSWPSGVMVKPFYN